MKVRLAYGRSGLEVNLPDERTTVIEPVYVPGLPDQAGALRTAIRNPIDSESLRQILKPSSTVAISVCDITRPIPTATILPAILGELGHIPTDNITILIANGTHRANTDSELYEMLGIDIVDRYRIVNHDAFESSLLEHVADTSSGIPIYLNREWVRADVKITIGFVEPHFFAGFSGGPKMIAPGLAGFDTIMKLHNAEMIGHPEARWGITEGNPIHDAIREIAQVTGVDFSVDVTINRDRQITSAYAGDMFTVHRAASAIAKRWAMRAVERPYDLVLTTNSGYPLDMNLYQAVKGMSAAAQIVTEGGTIICAAECSDGVPEHGQYRKILSEAPNPQSLLDMICEPGFDRHDQWQVQIQAQIQTKAQVLLKSGYLSKEQVRGAHIEPIDDLEQSIEFELEKFGADSRLCVLPEGPQTIPYIA